MRPCVMAGPLFRGMAGKCRLMLAPAMIRGGVLLALALLTFGCTHSAEARPALRPRQAVPGGRRLVLSEGIVRSRRNRPGRGRDRRCRPADHGWRGVRPDRPRRRPPDHPASRHRPPDQSGERPRRSPSGSTTGAPAIRADWWRSPGAPRSCSPCRRTAWPGCVCRCCPTRAMRRPMRCRARRPWR